MFTLPWTTTDNSAAITCTVVANRLPLRSYRDLPAVLTWLRPTRRHLMSAPGLAGHAAAVDRSPALWIVSAWTNRDDLVRFERSADHRVVMSMLRARLQPATFVLWTCPSTDLPVTWAEVRRRIAVAIRAR
jgi:hypothetical protein